jgi:membrane protease YdiL (CAAX protease family)
LAESFAGEKWAHEAEASVLPCPGTVQETSLTRQRKINLREANGGQEKAARLSFSERIQAIFFDLDGPRSGWRVLLYLGMAAAIYIVLNGLFSGIPLGPLWLQLVAELEALASVLLPALVMGRMEQRPFGGYGLPRAHAFGKMFWLGTLWGLVALSTLMLALRGSGAYDFEGLSLHGWRILKFAAFWGTYFLVVAVFEEFLTRGYTQFTLAGGMGFWPAAVLLSALFAAIHLHNPQETWIGVLAAGCIGFFFCLTLRRTGSLWFAVGFHAAWDWGESFLYSVPDSGALVPGHLLRSSFHGPNWLTGGSVGPEGSALLFVILIVLSIIFDRVYREVKYSIPGKLEARNAS